MTLTDYLRIDIKKYTTRRGFSILHYENCSAHTENFNSEIIEIIVKTGKKKYNHAHEWCCGHGAIGFELLDSGVCDTLSLSDIFLPAIVSCEFTASCNDVKDKVEAFQIEEFSSLPESLKIDLVVANPPHFKSMADLTANTNLEVNDDGYRQCIDKNWNSHRIFFDTVSGYLNPGADIYLFEHASNNPTVFSELISDPLLKVNGVYDLTTAPGNFYLLHISQK